MIFNWHSCELPRTYVSYEIHVKRSTRARHVEVTAIEFNLFIFSLVLLLLFMASGNRERVRANTKNMKMRGTCVCLFVFRVCVCGFVQCIRNEEKEMYGFQLVYRNEKQIKHSMQHTMPSPSESKAFRSISPVGTHSFGWSYCIRLICSVGAFFFNSFHLLFLMRAIVINQRDSK